MPSAAVMGEPYFFDPAAFDAELSAGASPLAPFKQALQRGNEHLRERFLMGAPVEDLVHQRAWLVDQLLVRAWARFGLRDGERALIAVGGYGRGELHPGSDIDLMILVTSAQDAAAKRRIAELLTFLWDIGLAVGHSVRTLRDCRREAKADITVATNLMEARLLAGDEKLFNAMREATGPAKIWPSKRFFEAKWKEQIARHHKYHDTSHNLEPNIKEGPGGLRDIQMVGWVAKRHFGARTLRDLVQHGFLNEEEFNTLESGQNFLWRIRYALHVLTGRAEDRLLFDYQRTIAQQFGYSDSEHQLGVEQFMRMYYRTVMELSLLNDMLLQLFQEVILLPKRRRKPKTLNRRFQVRDNFLEVSHESVFRRYPFALLEIFLVLQQNPGIKGIRASTIRLIRDNRHRIDDKFRNDLRCRSLFMEILRQPDRLSQELRRMHVYGVLGAYIPAFGAVVGLMQYDLFHVYTVDEHTLFVVRNLRRFAVAEDEHPMCRRVMSLLPKPELVYLAGMFHDIAKGRGGDHSTLGAQEAMEFCLHHGLSHYDARLVSWLVQHHLVMSMTAQRQDISDPDVITRFATLVADRMHLNYLYVLTVADIRGTNPTLWNSWKDALLGELYHSTLRALRRGLENPIDKAERIVETQAKALEILSPKTDARADVDALWQHLGEDYFLRHSADEIAWHTRHILRCKPEDLPLVLVRQFTGRGGTEVFVHTRDREYLFAATTLALDQIGLDIQDARIITSANGYTLDTYIVLEASGEPISGAARVKEITAKLREELAKPRLSTRRVNRRPARQARHFPVPTRVSFTEDVAKDRTVMEVITADRPGVLSRIGMALRFCGVRLQNAKIATFGSRVEDVFYITDRSNRPLTDPLKFECLRHSITDALDSL